MNPIKISYEQLMSLLIAGSDIESLELTSRILKPCANSFSIGERLNTIKPVVTLLF